MVSITETIKKRNKGKKHTLLIQTEHALGSSAFILFIVDTITENVYIQCIQKYFIDHKNLFDKLNQQTISINIGRIIWTIISSLIEIFRDPTRSIPSHQT